MQRHRRFVLGAMTGAMFSASASAAQNLLTRLPAGPYLSAGLIVRDGRGRARVREAAGISLQGQGETRRERRFTLDAPFRVASVSKMISAAGFMLLVERGAVVLDADISDYLGARFRHPAFPDLTITARMLLSHTSGLRNADDFPVPFGASLLERLDAAARAPNYEGWYSPAHEPPGAFFRYCDVNFGVIAQIIERVTQQRFDAYMREALFLPLGLDIGYNWSGVSQAKRNRAAAACRLEQDVWTPQVDSAPPRAPGVALYRTAQTQAAQEGDYRLADNGLAFAPHGGLRLSLADMDRLARVFAAGGVARGRRVLAGLDAMMRPAWSAAHAEGVTENGFYQAYGLGVQIPLGYALSGQGDAFFSDASTEWRGHCGDAYGWMTGLWWNVRTGASIVYALNGMPETERPRGVRSAMTAPEEALVDRALAVLS